MKRLLPLALVLGCESQLDSVDAAVDAGHPPTTEACRECHETPIWHPSTGDCAPCHRQDAFWPSLFGHGKTGFPLEGKHRTPEGRALRCNRCHSDADPEPACATCHEQDRPAVGHAWAEADCGRCHDSGGFARDPYVHDPELGEQHAEVRCEACHAERRSIRDDCACCHTLEAFAAVPQHLFPMRWRPFTAEEQQLRRTTCFEDTPLEQPDQRDCDDCHPATDFFAPVAWTHPDFTHVPVADCARCHSARATRPSQVCADCHEAPPDHPEGSCDAPGCHPGDQPW